MHYALIIHHAHLHRRSGLVDIAVQDGRFARIAGELTSDSATREIDAAGRLASPLFIDAHVHLDAVLTVGQPRYNSTGTLLEGIQIWSERKPSLTREDVKQRALEEIRWEVAQGTLYIRSHVDVCDPVLTALRALIEVREEVRDICELQLVAFSQDGILSFPNGRELMRTAMELERRSSNGIDRASQGTSLYDANARSSQDAQRNNHERSSWKKARQNLEKLINENAIRSLFLLP